MSKSDDINDKWKKILQGDPLSENFDEDAAIDSEEDLSSSEGETTRLEPPSYEALQMQLTEMETKAQESMDRAVRAMAELENMRRRVERDVASAHKYGLEKFAKAILPVIDSLEQALQIEAKAEEADVVEQVHEGVALTLKLLLDVLKQFAIEPIDPQGELFDPNCHEVMSTQVSTEVPVGTILSVFQKGYLLNERVIRPARVMVSKE